MFAILIGKKFIVVGMALRVAIFEEIALKTGLQYI